MTTPFETLLENNREYLISIVPIRETLREIVIELGYSTNGRYTGMLSKFLRSNSIDFKHFRTSKVKSQKFEEIVCPQCGKLFTRNPGHAKDGKKATCSHECGNKYFSEKQQYGRHLGKGFNNLVKYNEKLSLYLPSIGLKKECIVCGEVEVLDCHHVDEDRCNDDLNNLVFLCPTHHFAIHRHHSQKVLDKIVEHLDCRDELHKQF